MGQDVRRIRIAKSFCFKAAAGRELSRYRPAAPDGSLSTAAGLRLRFEVFFLRSEAIHNLTGISAQHVKDDMTELIAMRIYCSRSKRLACSHSVLRMQSFNSKLHQSKGGQENEKNRELGTARLNPLAD